MKRIICSLLLALNITLAFGQDAYTKHPKVIEVEMLLSKEATSFLQQRLPNDQVYVNVDIDPLRRSVDSKNEQLPYFASDDEVNDEWDAIDTPMVLLLSRIKRATIRVEVPANVSDVQIADLKEKLYEHLKLVPVRDSITFEKKTFAVSAPEKNYTLYYFISALVLIGFAGLFVALKVSGPKTSASANAGQNSNASAPVQAAAPARSSGSKSVDLKSGSFNSKVNGDINFKDSIRAADMLKEKLHGVINGGAFPLLSDMLVLEELSQKSLSSLGAFLFEMPRKQQQKVFFRGRSDKWFRGYIEAASVDIDCFMAVEKMLRNRTITGSEKWEELLVQVWRLDEEASLFLKQIPQDEAFMILSHMPKTFAVPCAKKTFPGAWARVLESKSHGVIEDDQKIDGYLTRALQIKPYFDFKSIDEYKKDLELIDYLRNASLRDEEEVYESLPDNSNIFKIRPPFYAVFKANDEDFKQIFTQYDIQDWALAVLNAPRDYMKKVTAELDEKKKYIFSNYLKQMDEGTALVKEQSSLREEIAKNFQKMAAQKNVAKLTTEGTANEHENQAA